MLCYIVLYYIILYHILYSILQLPFEKRISCFADFLEEFTPSAFANEVCRNTAHPIHVMPTPINSKI
jgi:hypothetical protein